MRLVVFLCLFISFGVLAQQALDVDDYIEADSLNKELAIKDKFKKEKAQQIFNDKKKRYSYPSFQDFWSFASEYWLVKNVKNLKWDQAADSSEIKKNFQNLLAELNIKNIKVKVFLFPTEWVPHLVLPRSKDEYVFLVSQKFVDITGISARQLSYLLYEDMIRLEKGYLFNFFQNDEFVKGLGSSFYINQKPNIGQFEKLMSKLNIFYKEHGYSFEEQYQVTKKICEQVSSQSQRVSQYQKYNSLVEKKLSQLNIVFPKFNALYPGIGMKRLWCK